MTPNLDIYRAANALIRGHGEHAAIKLQDWIHQCPLWIRSRHLTPHPITSAFGGKADIQCPLSGTDATLRRQCPLLGAKRTLWLTAPHVRL